MSHSIDREVWLDVIAEAAGCRLVDPESISDEDLALLVDAIEHAYDAGIEEGQADRGDEDWLCTCPCEACEECTEGEPPVTGGLGETEDDSLRRR